MTGRFCALHIEQKLKLLIAVYNQYDENSRCKLLVWYYQLERCEHAELNRIFADLSCDVKRSLLEYFPDAWRIKTGHRSKEPGRTEPLAPLPLCLPKWHRQHEIGKQLSLAPPQFLAGDTDHWDVVD